MNGLELRRKINETEHLRKKSIPFIFYSTTASEKAITEAYEMMVQGFFVKPSNLSEIKTMLKVIVDYWKLSKHPNSL
jgi:CheY-like chemotaxis protein